MHKATLLLLLTALFPVSACDLAEVDASDLQRELKEVLVELREVGEDMRGEVVGAAEEALDEFRNSMYELERELENNEELQKKLQAMQDELRGLIEEAKREGSQAWEETRDGLLDAIEGLREALNEFKRQLD